MLTIHSPPCVHLSASLSHAPGFSHCTLKSNLHSPLRAGQTSELPTYAGCLTSLIYDVAQLSVRALQAVGRTSRGEPSRRVTSHGTTLSSRSMGEQEYRVRSAIEASSSFAPDEHEGGWDVLGCALRWRPWRLPRFSLGHTTAAMHYSLRTSVLPQMKALIQLVP